MPFALVCILLWLVFRACVFIHYKKVDWERESKLLLVFLISMIVIRYVFFAYYGNDLKSLSWAYMHILTGDFDPQVNFVVFRDIRMHYSGWRGNMIGNILLFIPVGFFWPLCFEKLNNVFKVTLAGAFFSLLIEVFQLVLYDRVTDIDDLIYNTAGALIGACLYFAVLRPLLRKIKKK